MRSPPPQGTHQELGLTRSSSRGWKKSIQADEVILRHTETSTYGKPGRFAGQPQMPQPADKSWQQAPERDDP